MIERRRKVVKLYQGDDIARLAELREELERVAETEAVTSRRMSQKSELARVALEHDEHQVAMQGRAVEVTVWALTDDQFEQLMESHPPRQGDKGDAGHGLNMKTAPGVLLRASLVSPGECPADVAKAAEKGALTLAALGDLSRVQANELKTDAWNVNVQADDVPKYSAVSLLRRERADEQKQQPDTE